MTINDILNKNELNMRHKDKYVIILKTVYMNFTLGETRFHAWIAGELDLNSYVYTCKCLNEEPTKIEVVDYVDFKLYKVYISNVELQDEIYLMEDTEYNRRFNNEKKQDTKEVCEI